MAKMGKKMITLCSAAIGVVYIAGYYVTEPSEQNIAQAQIHQSQINIQNNQSKIDQTGSNSPSTNSPSSDTKQLSKVYKDGTYSGQGMNRIGSVEVAVSIKNDQITDVEITNCDTHYSQSYIDGLPDQVISHQSADVDVVSGATMSTEDFQTAVEEALQQAKL